jgi:WD40 repeat protein
MNGGSRLPDGPYKGLASFDDSELDERFFFGRDRETEIVASNLVASRLTVLYGPSGVGKSSLLRAGVVRRLRALVPAGGGAEEGNGSLPVVVDQWRDDPLAAIAAAAGTPAPVSPQELADVLAERSAQVGGEIYLVLDQMEEYFVYHGRDRGGPLREALAEILTRPTLRVHVLLGIRDDALADLDAFKGRVPGLFGNVLRLDHLDVDSARAAIVEPLAELEAMGGPHVVAEAALVAAVVDQVASGRIERRLAGRGIVEGGGRRGRVEAPYLQLVMERIWEEERRSGSYVLRAATLAELGGAGRIVQQHLERALANLDEPERELVARLFHQLVTPSGTKIAHGVGDLSRYAGESPERLEDVLHALSDERVVRALPARNGGGPRYEIYHDVLAGAVLDWGARHEAERALAEERAAARRRHRRLAAIIGFGAVALAAMGLLTAYAFQQRSEAKEKAQLAAAAQAEAEGNAEQATAARTKSEQQRLVADQARQSEVKQRRIADRQRDRADRQRDRANEEARRANKEAGRANNEARRADIQRDAAVRAKADAVASKNSAVRSKQEAVTSRNEMVRQRDAAQDAKENEQVARKQAEAREDVATALSLLGVDPEQSLQLALGSAAVGQSAQLEGALRDGLVATRTQRILPGGGGAVGPTAVSADGGLVVVPSSSGVTQVYELGSGKLVSSVRHGSAVNDVAFAPAPASSLTAGGAGVSRAAVDSSFFVTGGRDGFVRRWETRTGRPAGSFNHGAGIRDLAISPDGQLLATAAGEAARVWSVADRRLVRALQHPFSVTGVWFDPDGGALLTIARDVRVFDVATWGQRALLDQRGDVLVAEFSPSGALVATGGRDDTAMIWDWRAGTSRPPLVGHGSDVMDLAWSPRGDLVATSSSDNSVRVWRAETGNLTTVLAAHSNQVNGVAFSSDGNTIATSSIDGSGHLWWGSPTFARSAPLLGHSDSAVRSVSFSPDGKSVITSSDDGSARVWKATVDPVAATVLRHDAAGRAVSFSRDGGTIVSGGLDSTIRLSHRDGTVVRTIATPAAVTDVTVSPDGATLLAAGADGTARLYRASDGKLLGSFAHGSPIRVAAFDRAGQRVATGAADGSIRVWNVGSQATVAQLAHGAPATGLAFDPSGSRLATAGEDGLARIWRLADRRLLGTLVGHEDDVMSVTFSPDGKRLLTASLDADARLWNASTFKTQRVLRGHSAVVSEAVFSPDGRWIATAGPTTIGLWEANSLRRINAGTPKLFIRGHGPRVRSVAFAPDSRRVASTGDDGTVRTYLCELCGSSDQLVRLAKRRLKQLGANLTVQQRKAFLGG